MKYPPPLSFPTPCPSQGGWGSVFPGVGKDKGGLLGHVLVVSELFCSQVCLVANFYERVLVANCVRSATTVICGIIVALDSSEP